MDVMYFKGRGNKNEYLVVRALHYISKACLEKFEREFNRAFRIVERSESLFAFSSFNSVQQTLYIKGVRL